MTNLTSAARALGEQPAFPVNNSMFNIAPGLTKREYFIGQALAGVMAGPEWPVDGAVQGAKWVADAILNALASEQQPEQPLPDYWIKWDGEGCPVPPDCWVQVMHEDQSYTIGEAGKIIWSKESRLSIDEKLVKGITHYFVMTPAKPEPSRDLIELVEGE